MKHEKILKDVKTILESGNQLAIHILKSNIDSALACLGSDKGNKTYTSVLTQFNRISDHDINRIADAVAVKLQMGPASDRERSTAVDLMVEEVYNEIMEKERG